MTWLGRRDRVRLPPRHLMALVGSPNAKDFRSVGRDFVGHLCRFADLQPDDRVLDIGSGSGRLAIPLADFLAVAGSYDGIDVHSGAVAWCQANITTRHPTFRFHHSDVRNAFYNPAGRSAAEEHTLPFATGSFDVVVLASVFTHLLPNAVAHYLGEIRRVLAVDGRLLTTYFLLNDRSRHAVRAGTAAIPFLLTSATFAVVDPAVPESAVAIDEHTVDGMHEEAGLPIRAPIHHGTWAAPDGVTFQDLVLATPSHRI